MLEIAPFTGLSVNQLIQVKVRGHNLKGWGDYSEPNVRGQVLETLPQTMLPVSIILTEVTNNQIVIRWTGLSQIQSGGDTVEILSYKVQVAVSTGAFSDVASVNYGTNFFLHFGLVGGLNYIYKIKAVNKYGEAIDYSKTTIMQTGQAPESVKTVITQITDIYVRISWTKPFENYLTIFAY